MRATIVHESRGRMRLRLRQKNMRKNSAKRTDMPAVKKKYEAE